MKYITALLAMIFISKLSAQSLGILYENNDGLVLIRANKIVLDLEPGFIFENYDYIETNNVLKLRLAEGGTAEFSTGSQFVLQYGSDRGGTTVPRIVLLAGSIRVRGKEALELGLYNSLIRFNNAGIRVGVGMNAIVFQVIEGTVQYLRNGESIGGDNISELAAGSGLFLSIDTNSIPEPIRFDSDDSSASSIFDVWMQEAAYSPEKLAQITELYAETSQKFDTALSKLGTDEKDINRLLDAIRKGVLMEHVSDFAAIAEKFKQLETELRTTMYQFEYLTEVLYQWHEINKNDAVAGVYDKDNDLLSEALRAYPDNKAQFNILRTILMATHQVRGTIR